MSTKELLGPVKLGSSSLTEAGQRCHARRKGLSDWDLDQAHDFAWKVHLPSLTANGCILAHGLSSRARACLSLVGSLMLMLAQCWGISFDFVKHFTPGNSWGISSELILRTFGVSALLWTVA